MHSAKRRKSQGFFQEVVDDATEATEEGIATSPELSLDNEISSLTLYDNTMRFQASRGSIKRKCNQASGADDSNSTHQSKKRVCPTMVRCKRLEFFRRYCTSQELQIEADGMERLCADLGVDPSNTVLLVLAWVMDAREMCVFTESEWLVGMAKLKCDNIESLRQTLPVIEKLLKDRLVLKKIYRYAFDFTRERTQRSIDLESACAMLTCVFGHRYVAWPLLEAFIEHLRRGQYRGMTRDQWNILFEFADTICPDLSNYDVDGAWPILLDEFVEAQREARNLPPFSGTTCSESSTANSTDACCAQSTTTSSTAADELDMEL